MNLKTNKNIHEEFPYQMGHLGVKDELALLNKITEDVQQKQPII